MDERRDLVDKEGLDLILQDPMNRLSRIEMEMARLRDSLVVNLNSKLHELETQIALLRQQSQNFVETQRKRDELFFADQKEERAFRQKIFWFFITTGGTIISLLIGIVIKLVLG